MAKITLVEWAKKHRVAWHNAINWVNRGKLKTAEKIWIQIPRWELEEDELPPRQNDKKNYYQAGKNPH